MEAIVHVGITRHGQEGVTGAEDCLAVEAPLAIYLRQGADGARQTRCVSVTMRTPGSDRHLAPGFLFTEGILGPQPGISSVREEAMGENTVLITLEPEVVPDLRGAERNFYTTSSCGVCGKSSIEAIRTVVPFPAPDDPGPQVSADTLLTLPALLRGQQAVFSSTGGLHASALFTPGGAFVALSEDVGRHNALDKLIGRALTEGLLPLGGHILLLSGRASFELIQKAAMAGIRVVAAIGAPSSLAVELAAAEGITLVGFLRGERFNIYTHGRRIGPAGTH